LKAAIVYSLSVSGIASARSQIALCSLSLIRNMLALQVFAQRRPSLHRVLDWEDELFALVTALLDRQSLASSSSTFADSMYGLRRAPYAPQEPPRSLSQQQQRAALMLLVRRPPACCHCPVQHERQAWLPQQGACAAGGRAVPQGEAGGAVQPASQADGHRLGHGHAAAAALRSSASSITGACSPPLSHMLATVWQASCCED
jgi:hypothetical protein